MSLPARLLPEAKAEFDAAVEWYEKQLRGLGADFLARVGTSSIESHHSSNFMPPYTAPYGTLW